MNLTCDEIACCDQYSAGSACGDPVTGNATVAAVTLAGAAIPMIGMAGALYRAHRKRAELVHRAEQLHAEVTNLHQVLSEQQRDRQRQDHQATHDPVTGLLNHASFAEALNGALPGASLLLLDLDGFSDANDALGMATGDTLLIEVAGRLRSAVRHNDVVARLGSDEFAILLHEATRERARLTAVHVLDALRQPHNTGARQIRLSASLGMLAEAEDPTAGEALRDADLALHAAKHAGGDRIVEFTPQLRQERQHRAQMAVDLAQAIDEDELSLHYQPIVELTTGRPVAVEALARWSTPGGDPIPPAAFIPVAEQTGLVVPLGARVLHEACAQAKLWHERFDIAMTINISGRQLVEPDFADLVLAELGEAGLPGNALILEITEMVLVSSTEAEGQAVAARLARLRRHGIRIAIDDFGTGYSSLSYLHRLPIDILKIDGEFVRTLDSPASGQQAITFAKAILRLGESLQLTSVAEGVETPKQADLLRDLGCPLVQGFHFAYPAAAEQTEGFLIAQRQLLAA